MSQINDLTGKRFGRLVVSARLSSNKRGRAMWLCICDCGDFKTAIGNKLILGSTKSCGCLKPGRKRMNGYSTWKGMKARCYCKTNRAYPGYGGRGITVCSEWIESFEKFIADMGEPRSGQSLDRIDNDGSYSKENCRWASPSQQQQNRRTNKLDRQKVERILSLNGRMAHSEIGKEFGVSQTLISKICRREAWL